MTRGRSIFSSVTALALLGALGCVAHSARPAFRASVWIGDRGISIPLPPPSILEAPRQRVDVQGEVVAEDEIGHDLVAHVVDLRGDAAVALDLAAGDTAFVVEGVSIDLTDNCLELWLEGEGGVQSEHSLYSAAVVVDAAGSEGIVVVQGCDE